MTIAGLKQLPLGGMFAGSDAKGSAVLRMAPMLLAALFMLILAYQLAMITWRILDRPSGVVAPASQPLSAEVGPTGGVRAGDLARNIASQHLFGVAGEKPIAQTQQAPAQETRLNYKLYGVFVKDDPKTGAAIIGKGGPEQTYYETDEEIDQGVKLAEVHPTHVVISRNGVEELLRFPKVSDGAGAFDAAPPPPLPDEEATTKSLKDIREDFKQNPEKLMEQVSFIPVRSGTGELKGYRLLPKGDRELYDKIGIKPSDLITAVNGVPLDNDQRAVDVIRELSGAAQLNLSYLRGGNQESLTIDLN